MKKQYYTFFALLFGIFSAYSQYTDNYNLLTCSGKVPQDWQVSVSQKFEDKKVQKTGGSRSERATKANKNIFYLETTFSLDNMLRSGWVLYNDPISMYLEKIKTELQKKNPDIPKNIRIYTLRSPEVNAFATDGGVIFVTMGLMAKVQNEAELALILGHEIGHVMKQHSLNKYLEARNIAKENQGSFSQDIYEKKMLKYHSYAKENETEADALGLNFVLKTEYATRSLENVYEMLRLANIPFADSPFPKKMLETDFMKIRKDIFVPKVLEIKGANESESDSMSTHPNIAARKALLKNSLEKTKKGEGKLFLVSEQEFNAARLQARFELPMAYIDSECYEEALYVSAHLLQKYPKNIYLKKTAAKALYQLAKRNTYSDVDNREEFAKTEGELQQVYALMQNASKKEFHIFATNYLWRLMQDYPQEVEISLMCKELMVEMKRYISQESFFKGFEHWQAAQDGKSEKEEAIPKSEEEIEMEKKTAEALDKLTDLADMKWVADSVKKRIEEIGRAHV